MAPTTIMRPERSERPYNTRRKSLSLHSLGIHVPVTHAARAAAAASRASSSSSNNNSSTQSSMASSNTKEAPSRRLKRAHTQDDDDAHTSEPLPKRRDSQTVKFEDTPPPSPPAAQQSIEMDEEDSKPIDMDAVNDEIVEAVIVQLQNTGNRPHLVKELAAVLMQQLKIVQQYVPPLSLSLNRLEFRSPPPQSYSCSPFSSQVRQPVRHHFIKVSHLLEAQRLVSSVALPAGQGARVCPPKAHILLPHHLPAPAAPGPGASGHLEPPCAQSHHHLSLSVQWSFQL